MSNSPSIHHLNCTFSFQKSAINSHCASIKILILIDFINNLYLLWSILTFLMHLRIETFPDEFITICFLFFPLYYLLHGTARWECIMFIVFSSHEMKLFWKLLLLISSNMLTFVWIWIIVKRDGICKIVTEEAVCRGMLLIQWFLSQKKAVNTLFFVILMGLRFIYEINWSFY